MVFSLLFEPPGTAGGAYKKKRPAIRDELPTAGLGSVDKKDTMIKRKHKYGRSKLNLNRKVF